jgi:hypothetical protein
VKKLFGRGAEPEYFDEVFKDRLAVPNQVREVALTHEGYERKLRVIGMDSSKRADFFARGYVHPGDMVSAADKMSGASGSDLNIALVHHHLLAVRALEEAQRGKVASLADVTTLVNAGSLLESLAVSQVRLVLHGHEHAFNCAFYSSSTPHRGDTCVVAAPSVTGADSLKGCSIERSGYNLLELEDDGSVRLEAKRWTGGGYESQFSARLFNGVATPKVEAEFSGDQMLKRLEKATSMRMLVMRSESFFRRQGQSLLKWMTNRGLKIEVLLPDPNNLVLMEQLQAIYSTTNAQGLANSIASVVNLLREEIYSKLKDPSQLSVSFHQGYPVYSAYLFDDRELWYFPYHYRANSSDKAPVFVYPDAKDVSVYRDFKALPCKVVDLSRPFALDNTNAA